jgi:CubicO group peptidase (beta-lactamase class C family)
MGAMDQVLEQTTAQGGVPGVVAAYATRDGVEFCGASGYRCVASADPLRVDSIFRIASMTKAITSVAALQLVDEGRVGLDDEMTRYFPELGDRQLLKGFDAAGTPLLRPAKKPVTLRQLLTHTAGFGYAFLNADLHRYTEDGHVGDIFAGDEGFIDAPLVHDPGSIWEYGINTDWVGRLVEAQSGQSLGDYCRATIFEPLAMVDTAFEVPAAKQPRLVTVHHRGADGALQEEADSPPANAPFHMGGAGLYATAGDYLRFLRAILHGGELDGARILSEALVAEAGRDHIAPLQVEPFRTADPQVSNDVDDYAGSGFGLGFAINRDRLPTGRSAGSLAWAGIYNSYYWIDPTRGLTGVFLAQILPFYDAQAVAASGAFERLAYEAQ